MITDHGTPVAVMLSWEDYRRTQPISAAGQLDATAARQAVADLEDWPGERVGHRLFLARAWELRENLRGSDAMYVALAEAMEAVLLTTDARLGRTTGLECRVEVVPPTT